MPPRITSIQHPDLAFPRVETPAQIACREWYEAHGRALYGYLRFQLTSPDLAEDLTAEVFLRALCHIESFNSALGTPRAWLFRIAQNALRDHRRQARRRVSLPITSFRDLEHQAPSMEERLLWEEEVARLLGAVALLPAADQEIIGLCYGSDLSPAEAGDILGLTGSAARTRLWRALRRLRKVLAE